MSPSLSDWHARLDEHFLSLRAERDDLALGSPLFALEHGLDLEAELPDLQDAVRASVSDGRLPRDSWLPFVVYAAEVGYRYEGEEYWPVFQAETPNWKRLGQSRARLYIRERYEQFAETYGGAIPSGPWAEWFKNIAWPITHAVLPHDLQRHLARLLYDYRRALTNRLLEDHDALGERLALRSFDTSARFRKFAENTPLLGLVAASLLLGDDEDTGLLSRPTLHRIVVDLNHERRAAAWLRDAKKAAVRVRRRGFLPGRSSTSGGARSAPSEETEWAALELELSVRRGGDGWCAYLTMPSHASLAHRFPAVREELERVRYRVRGVDRVQPRGALIERRGPLAITAWPESNKSVLDVEDGSARLAQLLVDSCRFPPGPWLFHLREPGEGGEVRTNAVRPGNQYILLRSEDGEVLPAGMCEPVALQTEGVAGCLLRVPDRLDASLIEALRQLGVGVAADVTVSPAGLVPASWDGEGRASWPAGESPIIGVRSSRSVTTCVVATDVEIAELPWPQDSDVLFVQLSDLTAARCEVAVALLDGEQRETIAEGRLELEVLDPTDSASVVGARQALQVRSYPARPTLDELWTGDAAVVADGPHGEKVQFTITLMTRGGREALRSAGFSSALPIDESRWRDLFRGAQGSTEFSRAYDDAEEVVVSAAHPDLGMTRLRAERPFVPLRWCVGSDRDGPFARLIDHIGSSDLAIEFYDVRRPGQAEPPEIDDEERVRTSNGGLVVARAGELRAAAVLPPHISGGFESLQKLKVRPTLQTGPRTPESVRRMIELSHSWTRAAIPADAGAAQLQSRVNSAIVARLGGMIGGDRWWEIEHAVLDEGTPTCKQLVDAVGGGHAGREAALELLQFSRGMSAAPGETIAAFATVLTGEAQGLADPLLRLASLPGSLPVDDGQTTLAIEVAMESPLVFRLARLFVLTLTIQQPDGASPLERWPWE